MQNTEKIKVSACIVTHNNSDIILNTVNSILKNTTGVDMKLYISDNLSTDDTVKKLRQNTTDITIIENSGNNGFGAGHNAVLPMLDSKYHAIINPDITINDDIITVLVNYMENNPDIGIITPKILNDDGTEQKLPKKAPKIKYLLGRFEKYGSIFKKWRAEYTMAEDEINQPTDIGFCTGCFMLVRTELFKKIGGFDERYFMYFEDADLTREVLKTHRVVFYPSVSAIHHWERASSKSLKFFLIQLSSMIKYFIKR